MGAGGRGGQRSFCREKGGAVREAEAHMRRQRSGREYGGLFTVRPGNFQERRGRSITQLAKMDIDP